MSLKWISVCKEKGGGGGGGRGGEGEDDDEKKWKNWKMKKSCEFLIHITIKALSQLHWYNRLWMIRAGIL